MGISAYGQVSYREGADRFVPHGCIGQGNEHGACMGRGCEWCSVYYYGPEILFEMRSCYLCHESGPWGIVEPDDALVFRAFSDDGEQVVHESCWEAARDAWEDACREAAPIERRVDERFETLRDDRPDDEVYVQLKAEE